MTNLGGSGPNWSGASLATTEKAIGDDLRQTVSFAVNKAAGQVITVKHARLEERRSGDFRQLRVFRRHGCPFDPTGRADPLGQAIPGRQRPLGARRREQKQTALADRRPRREAPTESFVFRSRTAGNVSVTIDPPLPISYHGVLKIVLAADLFKAGKRSVTITFHTPAAVSLLVKQADIEQFLQSKAVPERDRVFRPEDAHPFDPGSDASKSVLDLRSLNEKEAGQSGFLKLGPSGDRLLLGDGTPVRLWAVNADISGFDDKQLDQNARWLARMGVNMVRLSGATFQSKAPGSKATDIAEESRSRHGGSLPR